MRSPDRVHSRYRQPDQRRSAEPDRRLDRLYDYTKFHIGIYLSAAAGLTSLIAAIAGGKLPDVLADLVGSPALLGLSLLFMVLAGACGGIVATSITECESFDVFWSGRTGPAWASNLLTGSKWVAAEHMCFWLSLACALGAVLSHPRTMSWLTTGGVP